MSEWQPIDSAPKDGRLVLLFCPGRRLGSLQEEADAIWMAYWKPTGWYIWPDEVNQYADKATHWMPLPENPAGYRTIGQKVSDL